MIPKILVNIQAQSQSITFTGCITQICFVLTFVCWENFLLLVMAYDRYVAICHPLRYTVIMNPCLCVQLILLSLFISIADALLHSLMVLRLSFCTDLEIPLFFCEVVQVIKLACSDTLINNILIYFVASLFAGVPLFGIIFSYIQIVSSILKMSSSGRKYKAFSTCGSHLSVVTWQLLGCTLVLQLLILPERLQWLHWCTLWSLQWWTPSSTAWGTETWRELWRNSLVGYLLFCDGSLGLGWVHCNESK